MYSPGFSSGSGKKVGQVLQIGEHGVGCSTYEGTIARGGLSGGSGAVAGVLDFTVTDTKVFNALNEAMEKRQEIEVTYNKVVLVGRCYAESNHIVTGFKVLDEPGTQTTNQKEIQELEDRLKQLRK
jgi:hypothetical protein